MGYIKSEFTCCVENQLNQLYRRPKQSCGGGRDQDGGEEEATDTKKPPTIIETSSKFFTTRLTYYNPSSVFEALERISYLRGLVHYVSTSKKKSGRIRLKFNGVTHSCTQFFNKLWQIKCILTEITKLLICKTRNLRFEWRIMNVERWLCS